jgi:multimeric flavodoxin WrbA
MIEIAAVFGSPRRKGNTSTLLNHAVSGARDAGADVTEIVLRDLKMSPCLEIYGCKKAGQCVIKDDYGQIEEAAAAHRWLDAGFTDFFLHRQRPHEDSYGSLQLALG